MAKLVSTAAIKEVLADVAKAGGGGGFMVVELGTNGIKPVYDADGQLLKFTDGAAASRYARDNSAGGKKLQPRPMEDANWRAREEQRLRTEHYKLLPWHQEAWWHGLKEIWQDHYPHIAVMKEAMISFTESPDKGSADIQTRIKPGRYLERFFGNILSGYVIRELCTLISAKYEDNRLMWAETEDEIEEVYTNGPTSCMSKSAGSYQSEIHPVRVYASGDLKVAYIKRQGRIVARALVYLDGKSYNSIYGDGGRLEPLLKKEGLKFSPPFGAKLKRVVSKNGAPDSKKFSLVCPHIDGASFVIDKGDHLLVASKEIRDGIQFGGAHGRTEWVGYHCTKCGSNSLPQRSIRAVFINNKNTRDWCISCVNEHAFTSSITGYHVDKAIGVTVHSGKPGKTHLVWNRDLDDLTFVCCHDGLRYSKNIAVSVEDGKFMAQHNYEKYGSQCGRCGNYRSTKQECALECREAFEKRSKRAASRFISNAGGGGGGGNW